jgi:Rrf2 family protein
MFKVSRKSEYALIAVQHLAHHARAGVVPVAEIAHAQEIPADILAKVLQGLKHAGIVVAAKGASGGYRLSRPPAEIRFLDVVRPFEEHLALAPCQNEHGCKRTICSLRGPMAALNDFLLQQVADIRMDAFLTPYAPQLRPMGTVNSLSLGQGARY